MIPHFAPGRAKPLVLAVQNHVHPDLLGLLAPARDVRCAVCPPPPALQGCSPGALPRCHPRDASCEGTAVIKCWIAKEL